MLKEGDQAPIFRIETDEEIFELKLKNDNKIIIFFFPRADTSGCTKEAIDFSLLSEKFNDLNVQVIGISKDKVIQQQKFKMKHNLSCILGADYQSDICEKFGVWVEKSMYGKKYMGIQRTTFLIDEVGKVMKVWNKVKVPNHANEVLQYLLEKI